jgi:hypothetical protein
MRIQQISQQLARRTMRTAAVCVLSSGVLLFTACASAPTHTTQFADARPSSATLTAADFARVPDAGSTLDAVRQLRPLFLRPRPGSNEVRSQAPVVAVYINDLYAGDVDILQSLPPSSIETMRYLQRTEAMTFAGSQTRGDGFIMITLKGFKSDHGR